MTKTSLTLTLILSIASFSVQAINLNAVEKNNNVIPLAIDKEKTNPFFSTTITEKTIQRSGAKTIPEALRLIPGMVSARPFGSYETSSYGGLQDEYPRGTRIEIDDVPVNLASTGSVFWESLPVSIEDVQRITFISSPSSSVNGEQTLNGVLKIYTFSADQQNNLASVTVGNKSYKRGYLRMSGALGENIYGLVSVSKENSDGAFEEISTEDRKRLWSNLIYKPNKHNSITATLGYGESSDDKDASEVLPYSPNYVDRKIASSNASFSWLNTNNGRLKTTLGFVAATNNVENIVGNGQYLFDINYKSNRMFAKLDYAKKISDKTRLSFYSGIRNDDENPGKFSRTTDRWKTSSTETGLGLEHEIAKGLTLSGSASLHTHSMFKDVSTYSAAINKQLGRYQSISLLYSQGFRYPVNWESRSEHYITPVGMPNVKIVRNDNKPENVAPEKVENISIKYDFFKNYDKKVSLSVFRKKYTNFIYQKYVPYTDGIGLYSGYVVNNTTGDGLVTTGLELHSMWPVNKNNNLIVSYAYNNIELSAQNATDMSKSIPEHVLTAMINSKIGNGTSINIGFNHVSDIQWSIAETNDLKKYSKSYNTANIDVKKCFESSSLDSLCATFYAKNILEPSSTFYNSDEVDGTLEDIQTGLNISYIF